MEVKVSLEIFKIKEQHINKVKLRHIHMKITIRNLRKHATKKGMNRVIESDYKNYNIL